MEILAPASTDLDAIAGDIRSRLKRTVEDITAIGAGLLRARSILVSDREFGAWRKREFPDMGQKMAARFMSVASLTNAYPDIMSVQISQTVLYELASQSVPETIVQTVVERARTGKPVSVNAVKALKRECVSPTQDDSQEAIGKPLEDVPASATQEEGECSETHQRGSSAAVEGEDVTATLRSEIEALKRRVSELETENAVLKAENPLNAMMMRYPELWERTMKQAQKKPKRSKAAPPAQTLDAPERPTMLDARKNWQQYPTPFPWPPENK
jgi:polyhydroxyalkanoate synthesis regulator phasin